MTSKFFTLMDIMRKVNPSDISIVFSELIQVAQRASENPLNQEVSADWIPRLTGHTLEQVKTICERLELTQSLKSANSIAKDLSARKFTHAELQWSLFALWKLMLGEMEEHLYFRVENRLKRYAAGTDLFGKEVAEAFSSIHLDLREGGNCLALDCNAAAVYHLMRVAEVGLWRLGHDRQIPLATSGKIEFSEWGKIIGELEDSVKAIQQWPNSATKEEAHRFYNSAVVEIRAFNDGWRRHSAHARPSMPPVSPEEALALWGHVERFMRTLATRISETKVTPLRWYE